MGKRAPPDLKAELTDRLEHHFLLTASPPLHSSFSTRHFHTGIWHEHPFPFSPADARTLFPLQLHTAAPPGRPRRPLCDAPQRSGPEGTEGAEALPTQPHRRAQALRLRSPRAAARSPPTPAEKPPQGGPRARGLLPRPLPPPQLPPVSAGSNRPAVQTSAPHPAHAHCPPATATAANGRARARARARARVPSPSPSSPSSSAASSSRACAGWEGRCFCPGRC